MQLLLQTFQEKITNERKSHKIWRADQKLLFKNPIFGFEFCLIFHALKLTIKISKRESDIKKRNRQQSKITYRCWDCSASGHHKLLYQYIVVKSNVTVVIYIWKTLHLIKLSIKLFYQPEFNKMWAYWQLQQPRWWVQVLCIFIFSHHTITNNFAEEKIIYSNNLFTH